MLQAATLDQSLIPADHGTQPTARSGENAFMASHAAPRHFAELVLHAQEHAAQIDGEYPVECRRVELRDGCADELLD